MGGIFSRFTGSSNPGLIDTSGCDLVVEPFGGSLTLTCSVLGGVGGIQRAIAADADPTIRAVYWLFQNPAAWQQVSRYINLWVERFSQTDRANMSWDDLKIEFEAILEGRETGSDRAYLAAVSLLYRALAHAGIVRRGKSSGKINVSMGKDQLADLPKKKWTMPLCPPGCRFDYYDHWSKAIAAIPDNARAIVHIDPPYWSKIGMEPCYPGHRPRADETRDMFLDCIQAALSHPGVRRVVAKNYYATISGGEIDEWDELRLDYPGWSIRRVVTGQLTTCAAPYKHGLRANKPEKPKNLEAYWTIQKEPFYSEQLELAYA